MVLLRCCGTWQYCRRRDGDKLQQIGARPPLFNPSMTHYPTDPTATRSSSHKTSHPHITAIYSGSSCLAGRQALYTSVKWKMVLFLIRPNCNRSFVVVVARVWTRSWISILTSSRSIGLELIAWIADQGIWTLDSGIVYDVDKEQRKIK